jgi:hypothetical protein
VTARISKRTGLLATAQDSDTMYETFMEGTLPQTESPATVAPGTAPANPTGAGGEPLF